MERCGDFFVDCGERLPFSVNKRVEGGNIGFSLPLQILNLLLHGFKPRRFPFDPEFVRKVHAAGLKLYTWTVDDPVVARNLAAVGVNGITTNRPGWLREQLATP